MQPGGAVPGFGSSTPSLLLFSSVLRSQPSALPGWGPAADLSGGFMARAATAPGFTQTPSQSFLQPSSHGQDEGQTGTLISALPLPVIFCPHLPLRAALGPLPLDLPAVLPNTGGLCLFRQVLHGQPQPGKIMEAPEVGSPGRKLEHPSQI